MDRSLAVFLRSLRESAIDGDAASLLPTATGLLTSLTNPLNLTLITSEILSTPSLWNSSAGASNAQRLFSVFFTAAVQLSKPNIPSYQAFYQASKPIPDEEWANAIVKGADDRSPRWRHAVLIGAVLVGLDSKQNPKPSASLVSRLGNAFVEATNLALQDDQMNLGSNSSQALAFVLNYTFRLLPNVQSSRLLFDLLLPVLVEVVFSSNEGLEHGYWLGIIDQDVRQVGDMEFGWPASSSTYRQVRNMSESPLLASLGPTCRLIAHCIESTRDRSALTSVVDRVAQFARVLAVSWRQNKLSEIDATEESAFMDQESREVTLPLLWQVLRMALYSTTVILRAVLGRVIEDRSPWVREMAPSFGLNTLHILRNLYFIATRLGETASQQYTFVTMAAVDIISQYPQQAEAFVKDIAPAHLGQIPAHPLDRTLDLFFLNTVEHFTLFLNPQINEDLVLAAAVPYLIAQESPGLRVIFEAAHSAALSVLAAPQNGDIAARQIAFYTDTLLSCFPMAISARQFRLAFRTLLRIASSPSPLAQAQPLLSAVLLENILQRAQSASQNVLPSLVHGPQDPQTSEQAVLLMALIDGLYFIEPALLREWLHLTSSAIEQVSDPVLRQMCCDHFWQALSAGEMDVERASMCHAWWSAQMSRNPMFPNIASKDGELDQADGKL